MSDPRKVWKFFRHGQTDPGTLSTWGDASGWPLSRAIRHVKECPHVDLYDPDTGECVYKSEKYKPRKRLLLLITAAAIAGCGEIHTPPDGIDQQHIDIAVERCAPNGGIQHLKRNGHQFWFTCNNQMNGVVIDK